MTFHLLCLFKGQMVKDASHNLGSHPQPLTFKPLLDCYIVIKHSHQAFESHIDRHLIGGVALTCIDGMYVFMCLGL